MDIFAHSLWTSAMAKEANKKNKFHISVGWAAFWGIFPDLFAFTIPFAVMFYNVIFRGGNLGGFSPEGAKIATSPTLKLAQNLYQYSHSLVIWVLVFGIVWAIYKKPKYELLGWALHILIDIPSHVLGFFPTPFLFPLSNYKFPYGIEWSNMWFMIINYSALLLVWLRIIFLEKKNGV